VIVVVEMIAGVGVGGVIVARVMIRVIPIVVLVMLVQHHCGEHVECLPVTHGKHAERAKMVFRKSADLTAPRFAASLESFTSDPSKIPPTKIPSSIYRNRRNNGIIVRLMDGDL